MRSHLVWLAVLLTLGVTLRARAQEGEQLPGDRMLANYFRTETEKLARQSLQGIDSAEEWNRRGLLLREQLLEMLSLDPLPERTDLHPVVTGVTQGPGFRVERLHFQSRPQLYVTANLYLPDQIDAPLPAILYVCGHGGVKIDGVSYGNKVSYQHHGAWFARHGYACLVIDTLQLGEIEGMHHGLYRFDQWKWINHGYTPAGVEAWNCVRALDYLETRPEVDASRLGVTGRSGGGAYSWWITAIDDRIRAAVPVAGITDLEDHVVHGCVEGHCDCMYFVNTYGWDYATVAALAAPRPLLISNTDRDPIFPLDGVMRIHHQVRDIYNLLGASDALGVAITSGPHEDTQELQVPAFRWLNFALKHGDDTPIDEPAIPYFQPEQLRVFAELPSDQRNTRIQDEFVALAKPASVPADRRQWNAWRTGRLRDVREKSFRAWPGDDLPLNVASAGPWTPDNINVAGKFHVELNAYDFDVHPDLRLRLFVLKRDSVSPQHFEVMVVDDAAWSAALPALAAAFPDAFFGESYPAPDHDAWKQLANRVEDSETAIVYCCPRGVGRTRWSTDPDVRKHIERRFYLLGQTLDGMQVFDIRRAVQVLRTLSTADGEERPTVSLHASGRMAGNALYAALDEPGVDAVELTDLPATHDERGPYYLNVRRIWDLPEAVAAAGDAVAISVHGDRTALKYHESVVEKLDGSPAALDTRGTP